MRWYCVGVDGYFSSILLENLGVLNLGLARRVGGALVGAFPNFPGEMICMP